MEQKTDEEIVFKRRRQQDVPELNTTSTADISFMLLVFFLVTSSMNTDQGMSRKLSPPDDSQQEQRDIQRSNVLQVRLDADDHLYCDDQPVSIMQLQQQVESFVASRHNARHVIAVETSSETTYNAYFKMQDAILAAYHQLREKMAQQHYHHAFAICTPEERAAIMARYPQRISEGIKVEKGGQP